MNELQHAIARLRSEYESESRLQFGDRVYRLRQNPRDVVADLQKTIGPLLCLRCQTSLNQAELDETAVIATGTHDRSGSFLCGSCWDQQCAHWNGPAGTPGLDGLP